MKQQQIDFSRGEQLAMIRHARLVPPPGHRVTSATLKAALKAIDDFGRGRTCYATQETIASSTGYRSRSTIQRAVAALQELSVIAVATKASPAGLVCNHYTIVWSELALLTDDALAPTDDALGPTDDALALSDDACVHHPRSAFKRKGLTATTREAKTWEAAEVELKNAGIIFASDFRAEAQTLGRSPGEVIAAVATYLANRANLHSPGALFVWLRSGVWPSPDVRTPAEAAAARAKREAIEEPLRNELARAARHKRLRAQGLTVEQIDGQLRAEGF